MTANLPSLNKVALIAFMVGLIAIVSGAVVHRLDNPSLTVHVDQRHTGVNDMGQISSLMGKLKEDPGNEMILIRLALAFSKMGSWERAATFWQRVLEQEPRHMRALHGLAMALFRQQDFEGAVRYLERAIEVDPSSYTAHYNLAIVYKHFLHQPEKARKHFEVVVQGKTAPAEIKEQAKAELQPDEKQ